MFKDFYQAQILIDELHAMTTEKADYLFCYNEPATDKKRLRVNNSNRDSKRFSICCNPDCLLYLFENCGLIDENVPIDNANDDPVCCDQFYHEHTEAPRCISHSLCHNRDTKKFKLNKSRLRKFNDAIGTYMTSAYGWGEGACYNDSTYYSHNSHKFEPIPLRMVLLKKHILTTWLKWKYKQQNGVCDTCTRKLAKPLGYNIVTAYNMFVISNADKPIITSMELHLHCNNCSLMQYQIDEIFEREFFNNNEREIIHGIRIGEQHILVSDANITTRVMVRMAQDLEQAGAINKINRDKFDATDNRYWESSEINFR